jgi:hypothetical protein
VDSYSESVPAIKEATLINRVDNLAKSPIPAPRSKSDMELYMRAAEAKGTALVNGINEVMAAKLMTHYPVLSEDILNLQRHLVLGKIKAGVNKSFSGFKIISDSANKKVAEDFLNKHIETNTREVTKKVNLKTGKTEEKVKVKNRHVHSSKIVSGPLFLCAPVGAETVPFFSKKTTTGSSWYYRRTVTTSIKTKVPHIPENILRKEKMECMNHYYEICAEIYKDKKLHPSLENYVPETPSFEIMWIPTANSMDVTSEVKYKRIVKDPVLLMNVFGRKFVVAKWDIKDEEEYDHLVREFTEGNIGKILDK